ncbi:hypothetical protein Tco_1329183 [Tanacetum coccineum]
MIRSWPGTVVRLRDYLVRCVEIICALCGDYLYGYHHLSRVCPIVNAPAGRLLGVYDLGVATPRALVHTGNKTRWDVRSWYMISGDANACHAALDVLHDALRALVDMLLVAMLIEDVSLVMSTPTYVDSETITQAEEPLNFPVPVPLPDDPYVVVRQAQLVDTDTESEPEEAPLEAEESQALGSRVPLMSEEFEASEPSGTRTISSYSSASSDSTAPLSPDHPLTPVSPTPTPTRILFYSRTARMVMRTQPTLSSGMPAGIAKATALSPSSFRKRYRSLYETPSPSLSLTPSSTEEIRMTRESHGLDDEGHGLDDEGQGLEDEGPGMEEEEAAPEGQQQAVSVVDTAASKTLGLGYGAARRRALKSTEDIAPSTYEPTLVTWVDPEDGRVYTDILTYAPPAAPVQTSPSPERSSGSLPVSPSSPVVPSPIASPVATPASTISVDEDQFLEVGAQLELHGSILHDHTQRLDALPPTLFEGYDRDLRELYTSAIWRPILALEAWAGQTDAQRQIAEERRERLELTDHVARIERR